MGFHQEIRTVYKNVAVPASPAILVVRTNAAPVSDYPYNSLTPVSGQVPYPVPDMRSHPIVYAAGGLFIAHISSYSGGYAQPSDGICHRTPLYCAHPKRTTRFLSCLLLPFLLAACTPQVTDDTVFSLYYYDISNLAQGETISISPSYLGVPPTGFHIYSIMYEGRVFYDPRLDGELTETDNFYIDSASGVFTVQNTTDLSIGNYTVSLTCISDGVEYDYPGMITVEITEEKE